MSEHRARVTWQHDGGSFIKRQYSRVHRWSFDGGITIAASAAPSGVPAPYSDPSAVDPEEAFVASIASCHMLTFLFVAAKAGVEVQSYEDDAVGHMTPNDRGVLWVSRVELRPRIAYGEPAPSPEQVAELHHHAHEQCYIANSVLTEIVIVAPDN